MHHARTARRPCPSPPIPTPTRSTSRKLLYDSPWIRLREDRFPHRRGAEGRYAVCGFQRTACGVLALDDQDRVVLVGQWRYPLETYSWETPGGRRRGAREPLRVHPAGTGAKRPAWRPGIWEPLAFCHTSNSSTDEETFLFLATDLTACPTGHAPEDDGGTAGPPGALRALPVPGPVR